MILSFYERDRSPWVWVQYGLKGCKPRCMKTSVRKDDKQKRNLLARYRATLEAQIFDTESAAAASPEGEWSWVTGWLRTVYANKKRTLEVYLAHWRSLAVFLYEQEINRPALLTRQHCFDYVGWRGARVKEKSGRTVRVNTAIGELKLLALVVDEAKERGMCHENPARRLGISRDEVQAKPEITDAELTIIFPAIREEWMRRSFTLALQTGLRFATTRLHRSQVDWTNRVIHIDNPKGGRTRAFSIPIYERIEPLLREWWESGTTYLWTAPEKTLTGLAWTKFFRSIKLDHLCFHCTRVTFISRGARSGISEGTMMKLVNHASKEVHRIYQRLVPSDAARLVAALAIPLPGDAIIHSPPCK